MAMAGRLRSTLPLLRKALCVGSSSPVQRSCVHPVFLSNPELSRNYATASAKEQKVKFPVTMYGVSGNYALALYIAAVKANTLEKVESELFDLVEASKKSPTFSQFMKDLSVPADRRVKAISEICSQAKFGDLKKNFFVVLAENETH